MKTLVALSLNPTIVGKTYGNFFWFWILPLIACQDIYQGVQMDLSYNLTTTVYYSLALSRSLIILYFYGVQTFQVTNFLDQFLLRSYWILLLKLV